MTVDTTTPRSRRALLAGALGGLAASAAALLRAPAARAGVDGDLVLETTNNTDAMTELVSTDADRAVPLDAGLIGQARCGIRADDADDSPPVRAALDPGPVDGLARDADP